MGCTVTSFPYLRPLHCLSRLLAAAVAAVAETETWPVAAVAAAVAAAIGTEA